MENGLALIVQGIISTMGKNSSNRTIVTSQDIGHAILTLVDTWPGLDKDTKLKLLSTARAIDTLDGEKKLTNQIDSAVQSVKEK